jgi:hypothetical protein
MNVLSFYRSQNVLRWSKCFELDQKLNCIGVAKKSEVNKLKSSFGLAKKFGNGIIFKPIFCQPENVLIHLKGFGI